MRRTLTVSDGVTEFPEMAAAAAHSGTGLRDKERKGDAKSRNRKDGIG